MVSKENLVLITLSLVFGISAITPSFAEDDYQSLAGQAVHMHQQGNYTGELRLIDKLLQEHPADPIILGMKERALIAVGQYQNALDILDELTPIVNTQPLGYLYYQDKAVALYNLEKYQDAEKAYSDYTQTLTTEISGHLTNALGFTPMNYVFANIVDEKIGNMDKAKFDKDMYYQLTHDDHFNRYKTELLFTLLDYSSLIEFTNNVPTNDPDYKEISDLKNMSQSKSISHPAQQLSKNTVSHNLNNILELIEQFFKNLFHLK